MSALLLGTLLGLCAAGVTLLAGAGLVAALVVHAILGSFATLGLAYLMYRRHGAQTDPDIHCQAEPCPST